MTVSLTQRRERRLNELRTDGHASSPVSSAGATGRRRGWWHLIRAVRRSRQRYAYPGE